MTIAAQDLELIKQELSGIREFYDARIDKDIPPIKEEMERIGRQLSKVQGMWRDGEKRALLSRSGGTERPRVGFGKYAGLDHLDIACVRSLLTAQTREPSGVSPRMLEDWQSNLKAAMDSTTSGFGDELVDTQEARALWDDVNLETSVAPLFNTVPIPSNPFLIPLQLGDVNWYPGSENVATKSTGLSTARQTLTAFELVAEVPWSYDLDEDAVIAMIAMMEELRRSLMWNAREVIDDVILTGTQRRQTTSTPTARLSPAPTLARGNGS